MRDKLFILIVLCISIHVLAQEPKKEVPLKYDATNIDRRQDETMKRFRDNRLGEFIHWGLYAIPGGEWRGKVCNGAAE